MNEAKGPTLYKKAKKYIPGGTQLLSKRPEMFLPEQWPSYYLKAKGCTVWDMDENKYVDMTSNGIGTCVLGFADDDVNDAVKKAIDCGSMCTLNAPEEVELAELLCDIHPWAGMVRYARCGGESLAVAVRIARAHTGRDKILICGYHGWHDWYLAANLADDKNLDGHLLPGLAPKGVPRVLKGTTIPFPYNDITGLVKIMKDHQGDVAAIVMEPLRSEKPLDDFLSKVRDVASKAGIVLIFDEVTAGFRMCTGGIHLLHGAEPDMAVFAKAISNGYPMAAIIGRSSIMEAAQSSFISSTYWTEKIGPVAALATIKKYQELKIFQHLIKIGSSVRQGWSKLSKKHDLRLLIHGIDPLVTFGFDYEELNQPLTTLFTQEMLKKGYLAAGAFYSTFAHTEDIVGKYLEAVDEVFGILTEALQSRQVISSLSGPVVHSGFKRLT